MTECPDHLSLAFFPLEREVLVSSFESHTKHTSCSTSCHFPPLIMTFCAGELGCVPMEGGGRSLLSTFPAPAPYPPHHPPLQCIPCGPHCCTVLGSGWRRTSAQGGGDPQAPKFHPVSLALSVDQRHSRLAEPCDKSAGCDSSRSRLPSD